jgi:NitT/TauT family transport system ATP-binding protein
MIRVEKVVKSFGDREVLGSLSLEVAPGEVAGLVGPSGCGKTTLLNILSGIEEADEGTVHIEPGAGGRVGYMMQESALLPWRTLQQNVTLGLEVAGCDGDWASGDLKGVFQAFDLGDYANIYPDEASAGMRQRIALMRTLVLNPRILLLDEPFSNLDFDIKLQVQRYLLSAQRSLRAATLLVTHDIEDVIALSDRVYVLSGQPTQVKASIDIQLGPGSRDPVQARKSPEFRKLFIEIVDQLKYLNAEA